MEGIRRQYLRPWLEQILNEACVPGVEWIDKDAQIFKIPWKRYVHASTRPEDFQIFRVNHISIVELSVLTYAQLTL